MHLVVQVVSEAAVLDGEISGAAGLTAVATGLGAGSHILSSVAMTCARLRVPATTLGFGMVSHGTVSFATV